MRRIRWIGVLFTASAITLCLFSFSCQTTPSSTPAATATTASVDPVVRGRYLVSIMSCTDCHTPGNFYGAPDTLRRLSGSDVGWIGPWGVVHARNLTPDSTGIGSWTKDDIVTAITTGHTPSGAQLAPIMPWMNYSGVLDHDDAMAIASYLKSLPPIVHKNLDRIPPGQKPTGLNIVFPPPPAWDVPPPPAAGGAK